MSILEEIATEGRLPLAWATAEVNKNFGDELSYYINNEIVGSGYVIQHSNFNDDMPRLVSVGTILHEFVNGELWVWGTGMDRELFDREKFGTTNPEVLAIRGQLSFEVLERAGFIRDECMLGDPGLLISRFVPPAAEKKYELGIIPHLSNYTDDSVDEYVFDCFRYSYPSSVRIVHPRLYPEETIEDKITEITACERILSSSVHGIIVADAFHIPNLFMHEDYSIPDGLHYKSRYEVLEHRIDDYYSVFDMEAKPYYNQRRSEKFDIDGIMEAVDSAYSDKNIDIIADDLLKCHPANIY